MPAVHTTVPKVKSLIFQKITEIMAGPTEAPCEVWRGRTNEQHQLYENIYIEGVRLRRQWKTLPAMSISGSYNQNSVQEDYTVQVRVEVFRQGNDVDGAEERMWEIVEKVEIVFLDPTLGNENHVRWVLPDELQQESKSDSQGWMCATTIGIGVTARI